MLKIRTTNDKLLGPLQQVTGIVERRHTLPILSNVLVTASGGAAGCLIDDRAGAETRTPAAPTASVPDAGSPGRRESAAKTLRDAEFEQAPADATLEVQPDGRRSPPPPPPVR